MGWGWHGWYMGWMAIFWLVMVVLIVWLLLRAGGLSSAPPPSPDSPEMILKRRYASGEISEEDYRRMLQEIRR